MTRSASAAASMSSSVARLVVNDARSVTLDGCTPTRITGCAVTMGVPSGPSTSARSAVTRVARNVSASARSGCTSAGLQVAAQSAVSVPGPDEVRLERRVVGPALGPEGPGQREVRGRGPVGPGHLAELDLGTRSTEPGDDRLVGSERRPWTQGRRRGRPRARWPGRPRTRRRPRPPRCPSLRGRRPQRPVAAATRPPPRSRPAPPRARRPPRASAAGSLLAHVVDLPGFWSSRRHRNRGTRRGRAGAGTRGHVVKILRTSAPRAPDRPSRPCCPGYSRPQTDGVKEETHAQGVAPCAWAPRGRPPSQPRSPGAASRRRRRRRGDGAGSGRRSCSPTSGCRGTSPRSTWPRSPATTVRPRRWRPIPETNLPPMNILLMGSDTREGLEDARGSGVRTTPTFRASGPTRRSWCTWQPTARAPSWRASRATRW